MAPRLQTLMVEFSLAYMIADFGYLLVFTPTDYMFIVHHVISSVYIIGCAWAAAAGVLSGMGACLVFQ
jgi:hypothetical protein